MREFAEAFLLVFAELAVGGLFTLSIPPFNQLERGFFKSTAAIYLAAALAAVFGWAYLDLRSGPLRLVLWLSFCAAFATYLYSLWGDAFRLRARSYLTALALGALALAVTSWRYRFEGGLGPGVVLYPLNFTVSALVLGGVSTGMLLGHWYLIDTGLTLTPFRRLHRFFVSMLHVQVAVLALSAACLWVASDSAAQALSRLWSSHQALLGLRLLLGPVAAYALAAMIRRTLDVPQTMAATGLFYIALLSVVVGEILGRTILFRTSLPL